VVQVWDAEDAGDGLRGHRGVRVARALMGGRKCRGAYRCLGRKSEYLNDLVTI